MNGHRILKIIIILLTAAVAFNACASSAPKSNPAPPATATAAGPLDVIKYYEAAFNSHNIKAVMALWTENRSFYIQSWDTWPGVGNDVQGMHEVYFGLNAEIHFTECQILPNWIACEQSHSHDGLQALGFSSMIGKATFTFENNKIKQYNWDDTSDENSRFTEEWNKFTSWYSATYLAEFKAILRDFNTFATGATIAKRVKEYAATRK